MLRAARRTHLWISTSHRNGAVFLHVVYHGRKGRNAKVCRLTVEEADDLVKRLAKSADGAANREPPRRLRLV